MTRYPCRCRACGARRTLAKHPDDYVRARRCTCGGAYRVDWYRKRREHERTNCHCGGYWWTEARNAPHRRGSPDCYFRRGPEWLGQ